MSELILIKTPQVFNREDGTHPQTAERLAGITVPDSETMMEYGYKPTGREEEETLRLDDNAATRLVEFYERCRVAKPEQRPFYNCHLLAWYLTSRATELQEYEGYKLAGPPVAVSTLKAGQTYAVRKADGSLTHSMVGTERPDHSLSVIGDNLPIAVIGNAEIISLYEGVGISRIVPDSALSTC